MQKFRRKCCVQMILAPFAGLRQDALEDKSLSLREETRSHSCSRESNVVKLKNVLEIMSGSEDATYPIPSCCLPTARLLSEYRNH